MPSGIAYPALLIALYCLGFSGAYSGIYTVIPIFVTVLLAYLWSGHRYRCH